MVHTAVPMRAQTGVTLIMVAGVLAVLAALSAGFYTLTVTQTKAAADYSLTTRASIMAQAGLADAIARMHELAYLKIEDPTDPWYTVDYCNNKMTRSSFAAFEKNVPGNKERIAGDWKTARTAYTRSFGNFSNLPGGMSENYSLRIADAASKININAGDNLAVLLDNLCRVIGPPLVAADIDYLQPRRWAVEGASVALYGKNTDDSVLNRDLYYKPDQPLGSVDKPPILHPVNKLQALYGDGFAIARYRSLHGRFRTLEDIKHALTYAPNPDNPNLESLERELKFAVLKDHITIDSWLDNTSVCTGKFEWCPAGSDLAIDRDKSWVADDPGDYENARGSLRGCYVSILTGQGAGQLRRIQTNGIDWIQVEGGPWQIPPGPISSYMIVTKEDATLDANGLPNMDPNGKLIDDPKIDYQRYPLCIHRAPVNINTASDKVLMAMFLGINIQHGHPMSVGTDVDYSKLVKDPLPSLYTYTATGLKIKDPAATDWKALDDSLLSENYLLTPRGLKRVPADSGKPALNCPVPWDTANYEKTARFAYLNNFDSLSAPAFAAAGGKANEVHELAYRILIARQPDVDEEYQNSLTGHPSAANVLGCYKRGPFRSWDDLFFRVIKPWDDQRVLSSVGVNGYKKKSVARMIMAHFNSNVDILKFNPNIEWIDRWGRNFTEMESVLIFETQGPKLTTAFKQQLRPEGNKNIGSQAGSFFLRGRRFQSDEMIDQTDMNRSTTQFTFDSNGVFELLSTGQMTQNGVCLVERKLSAVVKIYDVWRETTQRQFVNGTFSNAAQKNKNGTSSGFTDAGKVTRDATNIQNFKALDTLPEALVPMKYQLNAPSKFLNPANTTASITEQIGTLKSSLSPATGRTQYSPDIVANKVLPASYDGQIVLAANTVGYNAAADGDTFLASFNGDLDTTTCAGNGRELAKTPYSTADNAFRVVDTVGLLGAFTPTGNSVEIDVDPDTVSSFYGVVATGLETKTVDTDPVTGAASNTPYWQNILCRLGDLRSDGVFLGAPGISAKDSTIKYEIAGNFAASTSQAITLNFWMKPTWHANDGYEHEFFNATNLDIDKTLVLSKGRQFGGTYPYDAGGQNRIENRNCLVLSVEDSKDHDYVVAVHDGERKIPSDYVGVPGITNKTLVETPSYKVQPFRWSHVGAKVKWGNSLASEPASIKDGATFGFAQNNESPFFNESVADEGYGRPFIDTQRDPEGPNWKSTYYWSWRWVLEWSTSAAWGNDLAWGAPANPPKQSVTNATKVFSINNYDKSLSKSVGRVVPSTGTEAVIDEYKLSNKAWSSQRIADEQTLSRYYLPSDPTYADDCPTFTSQTLLQSLRGQNASVQNEIVTLARVTWTVFTPRFMHENKDDRTYSRKELIGGGGAPVATTCYFRGPFDYMQYNREIGYDAKQGWKTTGANPKQPDMDLDCDRKAPLLEAATGKYIQPHSTKGVEVELLDDTTLLGNTFKDPNVQNSLGTAAILIRVRTDKLRYRVRFRYPADNVRVDKKSGPEVNPAKQYLLDTPVFDDISVTYFTQPKILSCREITE